MAGAQVPLPETVLEEWVKGEPDPRFHDSDEPKRHPAIVEDEAIVRAIRSNLYVAGIWYSFLKTATETWSPNRCL